MRQQGAKVKPTEHIANAASTPKTGLLATLGAFLHAKGSGAPSTYFKHARFSLPALVLASLALTPAPALALNPERVYEMVSPPYKGGYGVLGIEGVALNGESVAFYSPGVFNGSPASVGNSFDHVRYIARRVTEKGWTTQPLTPPDALSSNLNGSADLSPTLETAMVNALFEDLEEPILEDNRTEFLVHMTATADVSSAWLPVGGKVLETESKEPTILVYAGASADFCHVLFANPRQRGQVGGETGGQSLLPAARGAIEPLYELNGGCHGEPIALRVVGVDNEGGEGKVISPACIPDLGTSGGHYANGDRAKFAIAGGGSEVFFTTCIGNVQSHHQLFVRLGGARTLEVSKPIEECSSIPCKGASERANADFVGANEAGSRVFFTASLAAGQPPLVPGDLDRSRNLYMAGIGCPEGNPECAASEKIVSSIEQVSHDPAVGGAAEVQGVVSLAPDGSRAYFVARGVLGEGANAQGVPPIKGADNLYVYERGVLYPTGHVAFVGDLCSGFALSGGVEDLHCPNQSGSDTGGEVPKALLGGAPEAQMAGVDGRYLVFSTYAQLVPGDTDTAKDVYRYDAETGQLDRVSGGESGYDANGNNSSFDATITGADADGQVKHQYELDSRAISEDGSRIVFSSAEALSPMAINNLPNVYEWHEEAGEQEGHVSIVSDGSSETPDTHAVISPDGRNVFFTTTQGLVPQDTDGAPDVYDARIEGGFPQQPAPRQQCSSDACQGPLTIPAPLLVPGSVSQAPGGNFGPAPVPVATVKAKKKVKAKRKVRPKPKRKRGKRAKASGRSGGTVRATGRSGR
jgi:hypothetical protein